MDPWRPLASLQLSQDSLITRSILGYCMISIVITYVLRIFEIHFTQGSMYQEMPFRSTGTGQRRRRRKELSPELATWLPSSHSARLPTRRSFGGDAWNDPEVGTNQHVAAGLLKSRVAMLVAYELEVRYLEVLKYSQMTGSFEVSVFLYF